MATNEQEKARSYNQFKQHKGEQYSGMPVGRSHKWYYDQGEWRERKLSPDEWEISYQTTKRRAARAPEKSGAPVGTEYNWLIVCHQRVDKLDANSYMTCLEGKKFKVAHKRASKGTWSTSERAQRKKVIQYLEQMVEELKQADESDILPYSVGEHEHIYGLNLKTKAELLEMARDYAIKGRSKLKRGELLEAVKRQFYQGRIQSTDGQGHDHERPDGDASEELQSRTKDDLYKLASEYHIEGRSRMNKPDLVDALANQTRH